MSQADFSFDERLLADIREMNLSYLILAQSLIRHDHAVALYRLGISESVARLIEGLSPAQIQKIAQGNRVLCKLRFDDEVMWSLLADAGARPAGDGRAAEASRAATGADTTTRSAPLLHAAILMAGRHPEALDEPA